mgnify:CR=1 FL=1
MRVKTLVVMMILEPFMILVQNGSLQTVSIYIVNLQGIGLPSMFSKTVLVALTTMEHFMI